MTKLRQLSIIIPVKNEEHRIGKCLNAISSAKSSSKFEVIVVDNGSTDKTVSVVENLGHVVLSAPEATISGLRNLGAKNAKGSILAFVDADVEVSHLWAEFALALFQSFPSLSCVTGEINISPQPTWVEKTWGLNRAKRSGKHVVDWASSMNMFVKKDVFFNVNGFNENLITCEDVDLSYRLRQAGMKILYDERVSVTHHGEAKTLLQFFKKEKWRGTSVLDGILSHGLKREEIPSLFQVVFFLLSFLLLFIFFVKQDLMLSLIACGVLISLPFVRAVVLSYKNNTLKSFGQLLLIWFVYYIARGFSFIENVVTLLFYKLKVGHG
jgi:glycosyltransferase involved in cell wall biosynthesis